ncbi:MAG: CpaF family protein [Acidimicrobiales bacterium]
MAGSRVGAPPARSELVPIVDDLVARLADGRLEADGGGRRAALGAAALAIHPLLDPTSVEWIVDAVLARIEGLGPLQPLLGDDDLTEIMVNGDGRVFVERAGRVEASGLRLEPEATAAVIERIVAPLGLRVDRSSPLVDARLPDGSRVNAVIPPLAVDGPCLTIRRFGVRTVPLEAFAGSAVVHLLRSLVVGKANLVVSGGTGSGKTTLLNALAAAIGSRERVITVEDAAELRLPGDHVVRLEARPASADGLAAVAIRDLVRNALRMRPDRILVGECRGGEALDMVQAMNTGHEGSLTTCHANSPIDALHRIETMILLADVGLPLPAVREQLVSSIDVVVQVARRPDGSRRVVAVAELGVDVDPAGRIAVRPLVDGERLVAQPARPRRAGGTW